MLSLYSEYEYSRRGTPPAPSMVSTIPRRVTGSSVAAVERIVSAGPQRLGRLDRDAVIRPGRIRAVPDDRIADQSVETDRVARRRLIDHIDDQVAAVAVRRGNDRT